METDTTAALEAITDAGRFELIAVAALRIARPEYTLSTLGVNADHKTVKAAVDVLGRDRSSSGHHVVLAAHATSPRDKLEKKWFYDKAAESAKLSRRVAGEDGDVVKAGRVAAQIREDVPDMKVTLILTTNRVPSLEVLQAIPSAALQNNIEIEVFDRSTISHVLDFTADGTAVRRKLLGIETDRISRGLLAEIGRLSTNEYARLHGELGPDEWTDRVTSLGLSDIGTGASFFALVGQSGFGKSALALQLLRAHLGSGGVAIWARAELIERAASLDALLDFALREWHPTLELDCASDARLVSDPERPIVLVVDDITRTARPQQALAALYAWSKPVARSETATPMPPGTAARVVVVAPVWPMLWDSLGVERVSAEWVRAVDVGPLSEVETADLLGTALVRRRVAVSEPDVSEAARRIAGDPFLASLLIATISGSNAGEDEILALAGNAVLEFQRTTLAKLAAPGGGGTRTVAKYRSALDLLASSMLTARVLEPTIEDVERWCAGEPEAGQSLSELTRQAHLLFEDTSSPHQAVVRFRHDRLRDASLSAAMRRTLETKEFDIDLVTDPLFASITGTALLDVSLSPKTLEAIAERTPAALAEALRLAGSAAFENRRHVVSILRSWSERASKEDQTSERSEATLRALAATTAPEVPHILEPWPRTPGIALIRLAHGSIEDGLWAIGHSGLDAEMTNAFRDRAIALMLHRHWTSVVSQLAERLRNGLCEDHDTIAALTLAGFTGASELAGAAAEASRRLPDLPDAIVAGLWAQIQCAPDVEVPARLEPLLDVWEEMPEDRRPPLDQSRRGQVTADFGSVLSRVGLRDSVATYLGREMAQRPALEGHIASALRRVDSPTALRAILPFAAKLREQLVPGTFNPWLQNLALDWSGQSGSRRTLSVASREFLRECWLDESVAISIRNEALRIWVVGSAAHELALLRTVPPESPMFDTALWRRGLLGDRTATKPLLERIEQDAWWYRASVALWGPGLRDSVERALGAWSAPGMATDEEQRGRATIRDDAIRSVLGKISSAEATSILQRHWPALRADHQYVNLALSLATPEADRLVADAIAAGMQPESVVRFIGLHLGMMSDDDSRVTMRHIRSIEPYMAALGTGELRDLASWCHKHARGWAEAHLVPWLSDEQRRRYFPTNDDLDHEWRAQQRLESKHWEWLFESWIEDLVADPAMRSRILPLVERQLAADPKNLVPAAIAVRVAGSRADVALLERHAADGDAETLALIEDVRYAVAQRTGAGHAA